MTRNDYPIYAEDGRKFCMRHQNEKGETIIEGPQGKILTLSSFMEQACNPALANMRRGKTKPTNRKVGA